MILFEFDLSKLIFFFCVFGMLFVAFLPGIIVLNNIVDDFLNEK